MADGLTEEVTDAAEQMSEPEKQPDGVSVQWNVSDDLSWKWC